MHCSDAFSHADASSRNTCSLTAMEPTCSNEIFYIGAQATLHSLRNFAARTNSVAIVMSTITVVCN
jgi:hypothetical protein